VAPGTCAQALAEVAPAETLGQLRAPLEEALAEGTPQDADRARTCAAAEALSALLACPATYVGTGAGFCLAGRWPQTSCNVRCPHRDPLLMAMPMSLPLVVVGHCGSRSIARAVHIVLARGGRWKCWLLLHRIRDARCADSPGQLQLWCQHCPSCPTLPCQKVSIYF
jgi:hypothetical protein